MSTNHNELSTGQQTTSDFCCDKNGFVHRKLYVDNQKHCRFVCSFYVIFSALCRYLKKNSTFDQVWFVFFFWWKWMFFAKRKYPNLFYRIIASNDEIEWLAHKMPKIMDIILIFIVFLSHCLSLTWVAVVVVVVRYKK